MMPAHYCTTWWMQTIFFSTICSKWQLDSKWEIVLFCQTVITDSFSISGCKFCLQFCCWASRFKEVLHRASVKFGKNGKSNIPRVTRTRLDICCRHKCSLGREGIAFFEAVCWFQIEEALRRAVWEQNRRLVVQHNLEASAGKHSFTLELNHLADMVRRAFHLHPALCPSDNFTLAS